MDNAVEVEGPRKAYGATVAVDEVSFAVVAGEVFGLVGPIGAGKTNTIECLERLRWPDECVRPFLPLGVIRPEPRDLSPPLA